MISATVRATVYNRGDRTAIDPMVAITLPLSVQVTPLSTKCNTPVILADSQVLTCEIADLLPGGRDENSIVFQVESQPAQVMAQAVQQPRGLPQILITGAWGRYINAFTQREEQAVFGVVRIPAKVWLPLILRNYEPPKPDLIVEVVVYAPENPAVGQLAIITLTIKNIGEAATTRDFWADLYLNPTVTPTQNLTWNEIGEWGAAWRVYDSLAPGESITLTTQATDDPRAPEDVYSHWPGYFPVAGDVRTAVFVDSWDDAAYGSIHEAREDNNLFWITIPVAEGAMQTWPVHILNERP